MNKTNYKTITGDIISVIMLWALFDKNEVTTLEIKNYLRNKGYWAPQNEVSEIVELVYDEVFSKYDKNDPLCITDVSEGFIVKVKNVITNGKTHRVYYTEKVIIDNDCTNNDFNGDSIETKGCLSETTSYIFDYILKNKHISSEVLANDLGISATSVRAYKANITRKGM